MNKMRIVITGLGVISPNGIGIKQFHDSIKSGVSGIGRITRFNADDFTSKVAGEVKDFNPRDYMDGPLTRRLGRFAQFAVASSRMAIEGSGLDLKKVNPYRVGVIIGNTCGGQEVDEFQTRLFLKRGCGKVSPSAVTGISLCMASGAVACEFGIKGPNLTISTGCSSALNAAAMACDMIRYGRLDAALVGGTEAPLSPFSFEAFCAAGVLSRNNEIPRQASRPFDKNRDGYVLSEAAGMMVIESLQHALQRNAGILAEIRGYGATNDCYSVSKMEPYGSEVIRAMEAAAEDAAVKPGDIDYINAHGSSSQVSDKRETRCIKEFFREHAYRLKISSIKSMVGQPLAATGALQIASSIMSIRESVITPTINYECPDPDCDLDYVPNKSEKYEINNVMINSFGLGGNNISMILNKFAPAGCAV